MSMLDFLNRHQQALAQLPQLALATRFESIDKNKIQSGQSVIPHFGILIPESQNQILLFPRSSGFHSLLQQLSLTKSRPVVLTDIAYGTHRTLGFQFTTKVKNIQLLKVIRIVIIKVELLD